MIKRVFIQYGVVCTATLLSCNVLASKGASEQERALLIKAASEMEYVRSLLQKANKVRYENNDVRFDYALIDSNIVDMQTAIERHASTPNRSPRRITPFNKHYKR